jgi:hypothetical protein
MEKGKEINIKLINNVVIISRLLTGLTTQQYDGNFCEAIQNKRTDFQMFVKPTRTSESKNKMLA